MGWAPAWSSSRTATRSICLARTKPLCPSRRWSSPSFPGPAGPAEARRGLVLALLTGLKQICNHPAHYLRQASGRIKGRSEKIDLLDELLATVLSEGGAVLASVVNSGQFASR